MRRKTKAIIAITLAACMTLSSTIFAYAETIEGDVSSVSASGGEEKTVQGDITGSGILADGEGTSVHVTGDVSATNGMGICAAEGATVTVDGDVTSNSKAIELESKSNVTVGGDVKSNNGEAVCADDGSNVIINGNAEGSANAVALQLGDRGTDVRESTTVVVGNNVTAKTGAYISEGGESGGSGNTVLVVEGTLKGSEDAVIFSTNGSDTPKSTVIAYKTDGNVSLQKTFDGEKTDASDQINYILVKESDKITGYESGTTSYEVNGKTYDTAKEGASVVIKVSEGYGVKAGTITVTKNADGTFTLIVPKGGGVTITAEAIQEAVKKAEETGKGEAAVDDNKDKSDSSKKDDDDDDNSNNATRFTTAPQTAATTTIAAIAMTKVRTATVDPSSADYSAKVVELIASVPANGSLDLNITNSAYLDAAIINALMTRNDVSVNLIITFMGYPYKLTIPAGYSLEGLIGADGKIDFAKLIKTFPPKAK